MHTCRYSNERSMPISYGIPQLVAIVYLCDCVKPEINRIRFDFDGSVEVGFNLYNPVLFYSLLFKKINKQLDRQNINLNVIIVCPMITNKAYFTVFVFVVVLFLFATCKPFPEIFHLIYTL